MLDVLTIYNLVKSKNYILFFLIFFSFNVYAEGFYIFTVNNKNCTMEIAVNNVNSLADYPDDLSKLDKNCPANLITFIDLPPSYDKVPPFKLYGDTHVIYIEKGVGTVVLNKTLQFSPKVKVKITADNVDGANEQNIEGIIDGNNQWQLFRIGGDALVVFEKVVLQNGRKADGRGGLLMIEGTEARVIIESSVLRNGQAVGGGLIYNQGDLTIRTSILTRGRAWIDDGANGANNQGGLIYNGGITTIFGIGHWFYGPFYLIDPWNFHPDWFPNPLHYTQLTDGAAVQGGLVFNSGTFLFRNVNWENGFAGMSTQGSNNYGSLYTAGGLIYNIGELHGGVSRFFHGRSVGPGSQIYSQNGAVFLTRSAFLEGQSYENTAVANPELRDAAITVFQSFLQITESAFIKNRSCRVAALKTIGVADLSRVANNTFSENESVCEAVTSVAAAVVDRKGPSEFAPMMEQPKGLITITTSPVPDPSPSCTARVSKEAYNYRWLHNTFYNSKVTRGDLCIDNLSSDYVGTQNNAPPASGFWIAGNLFHVSTTPAPGGFVSCSVPNATDKGRIYYLSNVEWAGDGMLQSTSCQRGMAPFGPPFPEVIKEDPKFKSPAFFQYGTFGAITYPPRTPNLKISAKEVCADPSVNFHYQDMETVVPPILTRTIPCSAGSEEYFEM